MENANAENANDNGTGVEEPRPKIDTIDINRQREINTGRLAAQLIPALIPEYDDTQELIAKAWEIADTMVEEGERRMRSILEAG